MVATGPQTFSVHAPSGGGTVGATTGDTAGTDDIITPMKPRARHVYSVSNACDAPPSQADHSYRPTPLELATLYPDDRIMQRNAWARLMLWYLIAWLIFCRWMYETWRVDRSIPQLVSIHWQYVKQRLIPSVWRSTAY